MRREPDEIIIEALKDNPKTSKELLKYCKTQGLEGKTYYRRLRRLIKEGKVKEAKYVLIQEKEANPSEVSDVIRRINESEDTTLLGIMSEDLVNLCDGKRAVHIPNLLSFLEGILSTDRISEPEVLGNFVRALYVLLHYERKRLNSDEKIVTRLIGNLGKIKEILKKHHHPRVVGESLFFLSETESKEAVDIILELVKAMNEKEFRDNQTSIGRALFSSESALYEKYHRIINDRLYEMVGSSNLEVKQKGLKLNVEKQHWRK